MNGGFRRAGWLPPAIAAGVVIVVLVVAASLWMQIGDVEISAVGWLAMGFGVLVSLALGIGLMALAFFSNRRGYDDLNGDHR